MKTKSKFFKEVYHIYDIDRLSDEQMNKMLMCGDSNWDYFFDSLVDQLEEDDNKIENVELVEFESSNDMFNFLGKLDPKSWIDYSTAFTKPCILKFV